MMNGRGFEEEVEDPGNIELTNMEESDTESRKSLIVNKESSENLLRVKFPIGFQCKQPKEITWRIFKSTVFLVCLAIVVIQTLDFYKVYSEYPTNVVQKSSIFDKVKIPAVTLCFKNIISSRQFCLENPDYCERPSNLEVFCKNHPIHCKGNISNLTIPMTGYYTKNSRNLEEITKTYLFYDTFKDPYLYQKYTFIQNEDLSDTRTFVANGGLIYKCYSHNLHLFQSASKLQTPEAEFYTNYGYGERKLELYRIELFGKPYEPQVFVGVHSPFEPMNPVSDGRAIRSGYSYRIEVQLEKEEHLLPPPYQTNCQENGPSKNAKNFTQPNSYEMCLQMCDAQMAKSLFGCLLGLSMYFSSDICPTAASKIYDKGELNDRYLNCVQNCKPGCLILHYNFKVEETKYPPNKGDGMADIGILFLNRKVMLERHAPLYGSGALFSHIGGLLGYWLGISVFNSLDIIEKFFKMAIIGWRRFRKTIFQEAPSKKATKE